MNKEFEILAPAGSLEILKAVILAGADAVWFVFRAGDAIAESDVEFYERCCKYACERLFVLTHVDVINEAAQRQTKERVQTIFHDFDKAVYLILVNTMKHLKNKGKGNIIY